MLDSLSSKNLTLHARCELIAGLSIRAQVCYGLTDVNAGPNVSMILLVSSSTFRRVFNSQFSPAKSLIETHYVGISKSKSDIEYYKCRQWCKEGGDI